MSVHEGVWCRSRSGVGGGDVFLVGGKGTKRLDMPLYVRADQRKRSGKENALEIEAHTGA